VGALPTHPSLQAFVLVAQIPARLEVYERQSNGEFVHRAAAAGQSLSVASLSAAIAVDTVYAHAL